jgi:hypothetical protein
MPKVKLNLHGLSALEKVAKTRQLVTAMTGNTSLTTPHPTLVQMNTGDDDLETAFADAQTARQKHRPKPASSAIRKKNLKDYCAK